MSVTSMIRRLAARVAADALAREQIVPTVLIDVAFDFSKEQEAEAYERLIDQCRHSFGPNVRWRADVGAGRASFGFVLSRDAVEFVLICDRPTFPGATINPRG